MKNDDDDIIFIEMISNQTIETNEIQNSIMDSKPISVFNNESRVNETPALIDSTQIIVKKVIISMFTLFKVVGDGYSSIINSGPYPLYLYHSSNLIC